MSTNSNKSCTSPTEAFIKYPRKEYAKNCPQDVLGEYVRTHNIELITKH